jgi:hypothetical protein
MCGRASSSASAPSQQRESQRQHARVERVFAGRFVETQITERGQRVGKTVDGGFGQAGSIDEITIAQQGLARTKRSQHLQATSQRDDKLAFIDPSDEFGNFAEASDGFDNSEFGWKLLASDARLGSDLQNIVPLSGTSVKSENQE